MKIIIDGWDIENKNDFYQRIDDQMELPDYFGRNLDALYDIFTEKEPGTITIEFVHYDALEEALGSRFLHRLKGMLQDAGVSSRRDYDEHTGSWKPGTTGEGSHGPGSC